MEPLVYAECLKLASERFDIAPSDLQRVMINEVMALEDEIGADLPEQYEAFLTDVGVGQEFSGLGYWFHCDLAREGNLLRVNGKLWRGQHQQYERRMPAEFFAVYDPCDGTLIGFKRENGSFGAPVYCWHPETNELEEISEDFCSFLESNVDLGPDEIAEAELRVVPDVLAS